VDTVSGNHQAARVGAKNAILGSRLKISGLRARGIFEEISAYNPECMKLDHRIKKVFEVVEIYWPVVVVPLLIAAAVIAFVVYWQDPPKSSLIGTIASLALAAVLATITWQYVRTNQGMLKLWTAQWKLQQEVHLSFGVVKKDGGARVWIANPGMSRFMVTRVTFQPLDEKTHRLNKHTIVEPGRVKGFPIPEELWKRKTLWCAVSITLDYEHFGKPQEPVSKIFTLFFTDRNGVYKIRKGIHVPMGLNCPKCRDLFFMQTDGLYTLAQGREREAEFASELAVTCPNHESQWALSQESVREHNAKEAEGTEE
jgi:hypothetical protein